MKKRRLLSGILMLCISWGVFAQSYTTTFPEADGNYPVLETVFWVADLETNPWPGVDERHPAISDGFSKKVQTSDWWTSLTFKPSDWESPDDDFQATRMYSHPLSEMTETGGLGLDYNSALDEFDTDYRSATNTHYNEIIVGMENLNSLNPKTFDYSDWMVTAELSDDSRTVYATYGHGNPYAYFTKSGSGDAQIQVVAGSWNEVSNSGEVVVINVEGHKWAFFAPDGSTWTLSGNYYTSSLSGENYWSVCLLPAVSGETSTSYPAADLETFRKHAYAFPTNAVATYDYDQSSQEVTTTFTVSTTLKESVNGNVNSVMQGLYPHQWANSSTSLSSYTYESPRGEMKVREGNTFTTSHNYFGVLATLPNLGRFSEGYSKLELNALVEGKLSSTCPVSETYNQGKHFTQFIQLAQVAEQIGNTEARDYFISQVKDVLENWLTADAGETSRILWYNDEWDVLVGYPDGHYMASLLNDKHFHWGYFIDAACLIEQYNPGWANTWGDMVNMLIRDGNSWDRNDALFPYSRNFDPYAGHNWAGGSGAGGNNQESSSESMNFSQAVIKWGELTGNTAIRDHGIYIFATEHAAIDEYWHDVNERTMPNEYATQYASRVYSNGLDSRTFWTYDDWDDPWIINILPITGGSLYLGNNPTYVEKHINDYLALDGIDAPTSWNDILWSYMALADPDKAITQFEADPDYNVEFAESKAHTYHWLHNLRVLGNPDNSTYATNSSTAIVFTNGSQKTYVAFNPSSSTKTVTFSDGYSMSVGAKETATNRDNESLELEETGINIALNKTCYSSTDLDANVAANATDGDATTRWESVHDVDPSWIYVDLEDEASLKYVSISWQNANAGDYLIQGSNDASSWTTLATLTDMSIGARTDFIEVSGDYRYVRIYGTSRTTAYGYSLFEIEVFETGGEGSGSSLPSPWVTADIGDVSAEGSASYSNGTFSIEGSGADIWNSADEFRFVYQQISGDATLTAKVLSLEHTNNWAKAGVMIRESLDAGSKHAMTILASTQGTSFQRRTSTNGTSSHTTTPSISAPYWVRIERSGDTFTSYYSSDGNTWITAGSQSISMNTSVYVGLVTTSHNDGVLCSSSINNVSLSTGSGTIDVTGVSLSPASVILTESGTQQLTAGVSPSNATNQTVSYSSSNTSVATVSSSGLVTALAEGSAIITVTTADGAFTANSIVTVESTSTGGDLKIEAEDFTDMSGIDTQGTEDDGGGENVGWIDTDDYIEYVVTIPTAGIYSIDYRVASLSNGGDLTLTTNGSTVDNITFDATGSWQTWITVSSPSVTLPAGTQTLRITANNSGWNINWFELTYVGSGSSDCSVASSNGEYHVVVTNDSENPTITFEPVLSGAGDETLLIYTSTDPDATFAGAFTQPNVAYSVNASAGETVYVYYTYSLSAGGEHTTYGSPNSFTVGSCASLKAAHSDDEILQEPLSVYPNPVDRILTIDLGSSNYSNYAIYDITGKLVFNNSIEINSEGLNIDLENFDSGMYTIMFSNTSRTEVIRILKN